MVLGNKVKWFQARHPAEALFPNFQVRMRTFRVSGTYRGEGMGVRQNESMWDQGSSAQDIGRNG